MTPLSQPNSSDPLSTSVVKLPNQSRKAQLEWCFVCLFVVEESFVYPTGIDSDLKRYEEIQAVISYPQCFSHGLVQSESSQKELRESGEYLGNIKPNSWLDMVIALWGEILP